MGTGSDDKLAKFRVLQIQFAERLPLRIEEILTNWQKRQLNPDNAGCADSLQRSVHSLAGSAGTFGFKRLGDSVRELEVYLQQLQPRTTLDENEIAHVDQLLLDIQNLANQGMDRDAQTTAIHTTDNKEAVKSCNAVYILEEDSRLGSEIVSQLRQFGYEAHNFTSADALLNTLSRETPQAIIIDIHLGDINEYRIPELLDMHHQIDRNIPSIIISQQDDWMTRLATIRAGAAAYFPKPLEISSVIEELDRLVSREESSPFRILIVDDNELLAEHYAAVLEDAGMLAEVLSDPARVLDSLASYRPEILLLDLYMPDCTGIEVARVIRQHQNYRSLPIIYLSTETGLQEQLSAMQVGGDDFLQKPISDTHLVSAVRNRVQRFRDLNKLMTRDSLTGLLDHINIKLALEQEISRVQRYPDHVLSFVMLDIDHFKRVNDQYGHPTGDRVIKSLSSLLVQRLRKSDIIGRYGGEEFAVILPDTDCSTALSVINELRESFARIAYLYENSEFTCSFSAGIANMPPHMAIQDLLNAADKALYDAKHAGRNRVMVADLG